MTAFRLLLVAILVCVVGYTIPVIADHGWNLLAVFFRDIGAMAWPGQFNLDFLCMLMLSGLWVAWRHAFSPAGIALGICAFFGGAPFLSGYLLWASRAANGDPAYLLLGPGRSNT